MTPGEFTKFRNEFASIVYWKGMVKERAFSISMLERCNKNGSHDEAIRRGVTYLNEAKSKLKEKLNGKSYDEWKFFSARLSTIKAKGKAASMKETKDKWQKEFENVKWDF